MNDVNDESTVTEDRGLSRLRSSTTLTLALALGAYLCVAVIAQQQLVAAVVVALAGGAALLVITAWERGPSKSVIVVAVLLSSVAAVCAWLFNWNVMAATPLGFTVGALSSRWGRTVSARSTTVVMCAGALALAAFVFESMSGSSLRIASSVVASVAVLIVGLVFIINQYVWGLILEVDRSRRMAEEVTRLRERERLANDLHDIQGQNMTVIRMKLNVVDRLLTQDPERARREIREAKALIDVTTDGTRSLIVGNRVLTVEAELANSRGLLEAAGADVRVTQDKEIAAESGRIIGRVVREATTNILKHSEARTVEIQVRPEYVQIVNDGVRGPVREPGGLASLEMALGNEGWVSNFRVDGDRFILECHVAQ